MTQAPRFTPARAISAWQTFWFRDVPPHSLALLRIGLGVLGVATMLTLTPVETFWSTSGLTPVPGSGVGVRQAVAQSGMETPIAWAVYLASLAAFTAAACGYRTRLAVPLAYVAMIGMTYWSPLPLNSGHYVAAGLLFWLIWTRCGDVLSLDARRRPPVASAAVSAEQPIWPLRLMRLQVAVVYFNSGLGKFYGPLWREGSAIHYVLHLNTFARFPWTPPPSLDWLTTVGTYVTLLWEIAFPLLLLHPVTRAGALLLGIALHTGMALTMEVGLFSWVMLVSYIAFLDPRAVADRVDRFRFRRSPARSPSLSAPAPAETTD